MSRIILAVTFGLTAVGLVIYQLRKPSWASEVQTDLGASGSQAISAPENGETPETVESGRPTVASRS